MIVCLHGEDVISHSETVEGSKEKMDIIVGSVKAFVRLCNKKDFSHLKERRLVVRQVGGFGRSDDEVERVGGEESDPVEIVGDERNRIRDVGRFLIQNSFEEDSQEEFSSTEDNPVLDNQRRKKGRRRSSDKRMMTMEKQQQMVFMLEM